MDRDPLRGVDDGKGIKRVTVHQHGRLLVQFHRLAMVMEGIDCALPGLLILGKIQDGVDEVLVGHGGVLEFRVSDRIAELIDIGRVRGGDPGQHRGCKNVSGSLHWPSPVNCRARAFVSAKKEGRRERRAAALALPGR